MDVYDKSRNTKNSRRIMSVGGKHQLYSTHETSTLSKCCT